MKLTQHNTPAPVLYRTLKCHSCLTLPSLRTAMGAHGCDVTPNKMNPERELYLQTTNAHKPVADEFEGCTVVAKEKKVHISAGQFYESGAPFVSVLW